MPCSVVMGLETEYGVRWDENAGGWGGNAGACFILGLPCDFLPNGGRLYIDCMHPEYATPECLTPRDLVAAAEAGDRLTQSHTHGVAFKANVDGQGNCWGSHENYSFYDADGKQLVLPCCGIDDDEEERGFWNSPWDNPWAYGTETERDFHAIDTHKCLQTFLWSRAVFAGSGGFSEGGGFVISPRMIERTSTYYEKDGCRLQVVCGETLCSQSANYVRFGATALLILCLIQANHQAKKALPMAKFASPTLGRVARMLRIQRAYLDFVRRHQKAAWMPSWAADVVREWKALLDAVEGDSAFGMVDWITKKGLMTPLKRTARNREIDARFGELSERGIFRHLDESGVCRRLVAEEMVQQLTTTPPKGARAWGRGNLIAKLLSGKTKERLSWCSWHSVASNYRTYRFSNILSPEYSPGR